MPVSYTEGQKALLEGKLDRTPEIASRVVRIFLSSTFTDTQLERDIILKELYPYFRNFCENLKLEFQLVDMRWGIKDDARSDHSTEKLCLREIQNCIRYSAGPNFVVFLCDKYGYDPIRTEIPKFEFMGMETFAKNNNIDFSPVLRLYRLDKNNQEKDNGMYIPLKVPQVVENFESANPQKKAAAEQEWWQLHNDVQKTLQIVSSKKFAEDKAHYYWKSVTEAEVQYAFLDREKNSEWCLLFTRKLENVMKYANKHPVMQRYVDFDYSPDGSKKLNPHKPRLLEQLKARAKLLIDPENHFDYTINCLETGMDENDQQHKKYLDQFKEDFTNSVKRLILKRHEEVKKQRMAFSKNPVLSEVILHANFCNARLEGFFPRPDVSKQIFDILKGYKNSVPIVLYGDSGCGKTSILASAISTIRENFNYRAICIYRFLATTAITAQISTVLKSVICQIRDLFPVVKVPEQALDDYAWLSENFGNVLEDLSRKINQEVVIVFDSVDQISSQDGAHKFIWLPKSCPDRVRIILSVDRNDVNGCLPTLAQALNVRENKNNFIEVPPMPHEVGDKIIESCLKKGGRILQNDQQNYLLSAFKNTGSPMYLKLAVEEAIGWYSFMKLKELNLPATTTEMIHHFLKNLEQKYGRILVKKAMSYLVAAKFGLSEVELEDILSLDNDVLNELYQYWAPPDPNMVRIPPVAWSRVKYDLRDQLAERQVDNTNVLAFLHKQFPQVIEQRYMSTKDILFKIQIHQVISEYFEGVYGEQEVIDKTTGESYKKGKPKEIVLNIEKSKGVQRLDRKIRGQPMQYSNGKYNLRKLNELPFHYCFSGNVEALVENILSNYDWLTSKIRALSVQHVIEDFNEVLMFLGTKVLQDLEPEVRRIRDCLRLCKPALNMNRGDSSRAVLSNNFAHEFLGRMGVLEESSKGPIARILEHCRKVCYSKGVSTLIPANTCYPSPSRALRCSLYGHKMFPTCAMYTRDGAFLLSGSSDKTVRVWDTETDEMALNFDEHTGKIRSIAVFEYANVCASVADDSQIYLWDIQTGDVYAHFQQTVMPHPQQTCHLAVTQSSSTNQHYVFCAAAELKVWDISIYASLTTDKTFDKNEVFKKCNVATLKQVYLSKLQVTKLKVSKNDRYLAVGYDSGLLEVYGMQRLKLSGEDKVSYASITDMTFTHDEKRLFYSSMEGIKCLALSSNSKSTLWNYSIQSLTLSADGAYLAAGGGSGAGGVYVWLVDDLLANRAQPVFSVDHTSYVGKCDVIDVRFCRNNDFVVSVSLSRHMGASGVNDYIDKSLIVATPIYKSGDSIILDGLTGTCTALSTSTDSVAATSDRSTAIKIFQVDREWGEMMRKSKVFIYRNPSYLEDIRSDCTVVVKCGENLLLWQEGHATAKNVIKHGHTLTCLAAGPNQLIASGDHHGVLCIAWIKNINDDSTPQVIPPSKENYDIHALTINKTETQIAALHNGGELKIYKIQSNKIFSFFKLVNYQESYADVKCMYFASGSTFIFGAKNFLHGYDVMSNKKLWEKTKIGKEILLSAISDDGSLFAATSPEDDRICVVPLSKNSLIPDKDLRPVHLCLGNGTGAPVAICFGGKNQDCVLVGSTDHVIAVYSIIDEDVITYAYVYDQPTKMLFRDGIIYSGMRNGQFCKLHFMEKPKILQPVRNSSNGKTGSAMERKASKTAVNSMISAEELFQGFGFYDDDEKNAIVLKPKGLRQILNPDYVKNTALEKKSKFHKMSAAIVSPNEIARIAKLEEERKMKLELKLKHAVAIGNMLPGSPTGVLKYRNSMAKSQKDKVTSPDSPGSPADRRRKTYNMLSFPSFELPSVKIIEETEELDDQKTGKNRMTPQIVDEAVKRKATTGTRGNFGGVRRISKQNSGRVRAYGAKSGNSQRSTKDGNQLLSDTESVGESSKKSSAVDNKEKLSSRKETPSPGRLSKTSQSKSVGEIGSRQRLLAPIPQKSSVVSDSQRKSLSRAKSLPEMKPGSPRKESRSPSKRLRAENKESRNMLQSIVSQYEEKISRLTQQQNNYKPKLTKRVIVAEPFSFLSRPVSSTRPKTHEGCMPVLSDDVIDSGVVGNGEIDSKFLVTSKNSTQNGIKKARPITAWVDNPSLRVPGRYINTFDLNTYYPVVLPRTKLPECGRKVSTSKFLHHTTQIQIAPADDFFDTELIPVKL